MPRDTATAISSLSEVLWVMNGLAGLGTLTPETSCNGVEQSTRNPGRKTLVVREPSATHTLHVTVLKNQYLKKSTRSVARQAKETGEKNTGECVKEGKGERLSIGSVCYAEKTVENQK